MNRLIHERIFDFIKAAFTLGWKFGSYERLHFPDFEDAWDECHEWLERKFDELFGGKYD